MIVFLAIFALATGWCHGQLLPGPIKPCDLDDYECMGKFLGARSKCNPNVKGYIPHRSSFSKSRWELPYFNATVFDGKVDAYNIEQCYIDQFDYFKNRDQVVITIACPRIHLEANRHERHYFLRLPTHDVDYQVSLRYPYYFSTIVVGPDNGRTICGAVSFTEIGKPKYSATKPIQSDTGKIDPDAARVAENSGVNYDVYLKEKWLVNSKLLNAFFINSMICNYGCL